MYNNDVVFKLIFTLSFQSLNNISNFVISSSYVIEKGVIYLVLCEAGFPKKLAFAYLEDLQAEFHEQHGKKVPSVSRPYSFIEFGQYHLVEPSKVYCLWVKV